jgi:hypothetical protein
MRTRFLLALIVAVLPTAIAAQSPQDDVRWRIRREAVEHSQILKTLHVLTDVYGPRLTGSPSLEAAGDWVVKQSAEWGLVNGALEPWDFGHEGWTNERLTAHLVSPVKDALVAEVLAWTPSTKGVVTAGVYPLVLPDRVTQKELDAALEKVGDAVKGQIVLVGQPERVPVTIVPSPKRREESELRSQYDPINPAPSPYAAMANQRPAAPKDGEPVTLTARQVNEAVDAFLVKRGALVRVNDAGREHGQIRAFNNRTFDLAKAVPTIVFRNEDFGRISRLVADGRAVTLEIEIVNRTWPKGKTAYNVVAEIPGTDLKDEVVMLGGHLDSWHAATGATDNAIGAAVTMEAVRIIKALGLKPRRTIRLALWSGEEQGLLGSLAYVKKHFGSFEEPAAEYEKFAGYVNIDSGTGRARGMSVFGPPETAAFIRPTVTSLADLGLVGTVASSSRRQGGSDHTSFNAAGLPGIGVSQDPIEYQSATWHTNLDTYERVIESDAQTSAIAIATLVYDLATRDQKLPRFEKDKMPKAAPTDDAPGTAPAPAPTPTASPTRTQR